MMIIFKVLAKVRKKLDILFCFGENKENSVSNLAYFFDYSFLFKENVVILHPNKRETFITFYNKSR